MPQTAADFKKKRRGSIDVYGDGSVFINYLTTNFTDELVLQMDEIRAKDDPKERLKIMTAWLIGMLDPADPWDLIDDKDKSKGWPLTEGNLRSLGLVVQQDFIDAINADVEGKKVKPSNSTGT